MDAAGVQLGLDGLLQVIADVALGHGAALGERHIRGVAALVGGKLHGQVDHAHLGAVAVADDDLVAFFHQVHDGLGGLLHQLQLLFGGISKGVAPQRHYDSLTHSLTSESRTSQP